MARSGVHELAATCSLAAVSTAMILSTSSTADVSRDAWFRLLSSFCKASISVYEYAGQNLKLVSGVVPNHHTGDESSRDSVTQTSDTTPRSCVKLCFVVRALAILFPRMDLSLL